MPPYVPLFPFHCWARKEPVPPTTRFTVGLERSLFSTTRFTVGQERSLLPYHPFHCWAEKEHQGGGIPTYPPWCPGTTRVYMPPFQPYLRVDLSLFLSLQDQWCTSSSVCTRAGCGNYTLVTGLENVGITREERCLYHLRNKPPSHRKQT